jgi:hypothetical protein
MNNLITPAAAEKKNWVDDGSIPLLVRPYTQ